MRVCTQLAESILQLLKKSDSQTRIILHTMDKGITSMHTSMLQDESDLIILKILLYTAVPASKETNCKIFAISHVKLTCRTIFYTPTPIIHFHQYLQLAHQKNKSFNCNHNLTHIQIHNHNHILNHNHNHKQIIKLRCITLHELCIRS